MHIIKLDATDSTNSFLRRLNASESLEDYTIATANYQTNGRGQMGTVWESQEAKNLIFSVFKDVSFLQIEQNFYISMAVSLSVLKALELMQIQQLKIKWPNDILSDTKKLAGILIENIIKQSQLQASIIGLGLNVNQTEFERLPQASSLRLVGGKVYVIDEILQMIVEQLVYHFKLLKQRKFKMIKETYETYLFRKNKPSTFKNIEGQLFSGFIVGVTHSGNLKVKIEDGILKEFELKEITLMY